VDRLVVAVVVVVALPADARRVHLREGHHLPHDALRRISRETHRIHQDLVGFVEGDVLEDRDLVVVQFPQDADGLAVRRNPRTVMRTVTSSSLRWGVASFSIFRECRKSLFLLMGGIYS
jgi:hypothetical protein